MSLAVSIENSPISERALCVVTQKHLEESTAVGYFRGEPVTAGFELEIGHVYG